MPKLTSGLVAGIDGCKVVFKMSKRILLLLAMIASVCSLFSEVEAASSDVKVGFIFLHDENSTYDLNFMNAAKIACENAGVEYTFKTNIPETEVCYETAVELVNQGCNIIFSDSFGHEEFLIKAAKRFPNIQFCHATGTRAHTEGISNFHNAFASIYEGRYLSGIVAGMKLNEMIKSGKISRNQAKLGYVGAFPYAEVISGYTAFFLGARSVCPTAEMDVVFTNSWYDYDLEAKSAEKLIKRGCVIISQHADSMGAPSVCESNGVFNVFYNGNLIEKCPKTFLISSRINWTPYFDYIINCAKMGKEIETDWTGSLLTGSVELTEMNKNVSAKGTDKAISKAKLAIESGSLKVFDIKRFTVNRKNLTSYMADVDTDPNFTGDKEVIFDGYFHESEFRSAPYFDLKIDGINLID